MLDYGGIKATCRLCDEVIVQVDSLDVRRAETVDEAMERHGAFIKAAATEHYVMHTARVMLDLDEPGQHAELAAA